MLEDVPPLLKILSTRNILKRHSLLTTFSKVKAEPETISSDGSIFRHRLLSLWSKLAKTYVTTGKTEMLISW